MHLLFFLKKKKKKREEKEKEKKISPKKKSACTIQSPPTSPEPDEIPPPPPLLLAAPGDLLLPHHLSTAAALAAAPPTPTEWTTAPVASVGAATADASLFHVSLDLSSRADLLASHVAAGQFLPFRLPAAPYPIFLAISSSTLAPGLATNFDFLIKRLPGTPSACLSDQRPGAHVHVGGSVVGRGFEVGRIADARDVLVFATGSGIR